MKQGTLVPFSKGCPNPLTSKTLKSQLWDRGSQLHRLSINYHEIQSWQHDERAIGFHKC